MAPYFPTGLDADENRSWKRQYADTCVSIFDKFAPGLADSVTNRVVFSNRYVGSTFSARAGDYSRGLLQPNQLRTAASWRVPTNSPPRSTGSFCAVSAPTRVPA
jgi:hypothetical protein